MVENRNTKEEKVEYERNYFLTPSTSLDEQRQVASYDSFDESNEPYQKSTARIVLRKYVIK
jgi:hypothetical protein